METLIKMSELIGSELRSRTEAKKIHNSISLVRNGKIIISFSGVTFISRSFADEFCGIIENVKLSKNIEIVDKCNNVEVTLAIVLKIGIIQRMFKKALIRKNFLIWIAYLNF